MRLYNEGWLWLRSFLAALLLVSMTAASTTNDDNVASVLQQLDAALEGVDRLESFMEKVVKDIDATAALQKDLTQLHADINSKQQGIQTAWTAWNERRWHDLQAQLASILEAELERRQNAQQQVQDYLQRRRQQQGQTKQSSASRQTAVPLSPEALHEMLSPAAFTKLRDEKIGGWIETLLEQTLQDRPLPRYEWAQAPTIAAVHNEDTCWTLVEATEYVQQALTNYSHDGVGLTDHATAGRIAHSATSPTYHATTPAPGTTWGTSLWRDYLIPQEVEEHLLSHFAGWEDWPVGLPTEYLPHALARLWAASTAPPETILQPATFPGACWPLAGSSGQVTIVLPYPIRPTAITIDHVSHLLVEDRTAAPRTMRVWGYENCSDHDCRGLEYDPDAVYDLFGGQTVEYNLKQTSSVQSFWIPASSKSVQTNKDPASCTAPDDETPSCSGDVSTLPLDTLIRAVRLEVVDNWGNGDYTCLYRVRVHGNPSLEDKN